MLKAWPVAGNLAAPAEDPAYPYVVTTYRLTEHHLSGVMRRWLPSLAEEKGVANTEVVRVSTPQGSMRSRSSAIWRRRSWLLAVGSWLLTASPRSDFDYGFMFAVLPSDRPLIADSAPQTSPEPSIQTLPVVTAGGPVK